MGQSRPLFVYFRRFLITISIIKIEKSLDGVLGIQTRGCRMVGADKTMELWQPPPINILRPLIIKLLTSIAVKQVTHRQWMNLCIKYTLYVTSTMQNKLS